MRYICFLILLFPLIASGQRQSLNLNEGWYFSDQKCAEAFLPDYDDSSWEQLDLPHDYSMNGDYDSINTPQNAWLPIADCWYRKKIQYDASWSGKRLYLWFDGVYMDSEVYVNGKLVGNRPYGFISFYFDITDFVHPGDNVICVRAKNEKAPTARFYHGSGIYGYTELLIVPEIHIPVSGGVFCHTISCSEKEAVVDISTEVLNNGEKAQKVLVRHILMNADGSEVLRSELSEVQLMALEKDTLSGRISVLKPRLWDCETPNLYKLCTEVLINGIVEDRIYTSVGIRTIDYNPNTGFYLNGKNIKLQGVCEHMEMLPVGFAIPDDLWRKRIMLLKNMGCNAIRTAHNPFPPKFYELCDELGMMIVDEIFDGWRRKGANDYGGRFFAKWWKKDVEDWIRRDRNHPSVIMWSVGNETGDTDIHNITEHIHLHDAWTRPTSGGNVLYGTDISGFTGQGGMPGALEKFHEENPERAIVLTEVPHTIQTRGFYRVPTWWRDKGGAVNEYKPYGTKQIFFDGLPRYRSSYDNCAVRLNARMSWKRTKNTPWIIGEFRWTGYDCLGESQFMGAEFPKRSYNAGIIDFAGFPKDHYYFYQSQWTQKPMVHILPHWTHPELKKGQEVPVVVYSNCDEVELFLNDKSLGRKKTGDLLDFVWQVPYVQGKIEAIGYNKGIISVSACHQTASYPEKLILSVDNPYEEKADGTVAYLDISSVDGEGNFVPWTCNEILFHVSGRTTVLGFENGNPIDGMNNKNLKRRFFYGLARGFFQNTTNDVPVKVTAATILGDTLFEDKTQVSIAVSSVMLRGRSTTDKYEIYYTLNGEKPDNNSLHYERAFMIKKNKQIRAAIYCNGERLFELKENFRKGKVTQFIDPMLQTEDVLKNKFVGPFDKEVIGRWSINETTYLFEKTGVLYEFSGKYFPKRVGQWWYDYPNDKFENPDDRGRGEIKWDKDSSISFIELSGQNENKLQITDGTVKKILDRTDKNKD